MSMNKLHVAVSPITNTIFCGGILKDGRTWAANKTDVTGQSCAAVAQHTLAKGGEIIVNCNGKPKYEIRVIDLDAIASTEEGK